MGTEAVTAGVGTGEAPWWSWRRKPRRWEVVVIVVAGVIALGLQLLNIPPSEAPFREYVAALRASGEPTTIAEYLSLEADTEDNAAAVIAAAATEARARASGAPWPWEANATYDWLATAYPQEVGAIRARVEELRPFYARLDAASQASHLACEFAWAGDNDPLVPGLQACARLLSARAVVAESPDERIHAVETMARLSHLAHGTLVRRMVGIAFIYAVTKSIRHEVEASLIEPAAARARLDPILMKERLPTFPELARGERIGWTDTFAQLLDGRMTPADDFKALAPVADEWRPRRLVGLFQNRGTPVGSPADCVAACELLTEIGSIDATSFRTWKRTLDARIAALPSISLTRYVAMVPARLATEIGRVDAATRLARIALAAAEHRATHGDYPASLADLAWAFPDGVPLDPYTDVAFVYARTPTGVRIASAGRLADDPAVDEAELREKCLVWELKR